MAICATLLFGYDDVHERALGDAAPAGSFLDVMNMVDDEDYWLYPIIF